MFYRGLTFFLYLGIVRVSTEYERTEGRRVRKTDLMQGTGRGGGTQS